MKKFTPFLLGLGAITLSLVVVFVQYNEKKEKEEFPSYSSPNTNTIQSQDSTPNKPQNTPTKVTSPNSPSTVTQNPSSSPASYSMVDVVKHNKSSDCWTVVNGGVYNVTSWINEHPGGASAIISMCGVDGSSAFDDQHGGQRSPERELASFKIGNLK